jgi:hypothetical protein
MTRDWVVIPGAASSSVIAGDPLNPPRATADTMKYGWRSCRLSRVPVLVVHVSEESAS